MPEESSQDVTQLLSRWSDGDAEALEALTPIIYSELHKIARRYMGRERAGHTLQTTALVNEAYVRLIDWKNAKFEVGGKSLGYYDFVRASLTQR